MRKNIAIVTGGDSGEYEISLKSAKNVVENLDVSLYEAFTIHLRGNNWTFTNIDNKVYHINKDDFSLTIGENKVFFDCAFILIHGNPGENGKLQGYFDMLNIPYTGCNAAVSALTFNKDFCNRVVASHGVKISKSVSLFKDEPFNKDDVLETLGSLPYFVKPCNSGSSIGMSKVNVIEEFMPALQKAFEYDCQLLVEKFVSGREITCGVMRIDDEVRALAVTEIISKREFFDFEAKYDASLADEITPAQIPLTIEDSCKSISKKIYAFLGCKGISRLDFIYNDTGLYFIEINTIPGLTNESIIRKQLRYLGLNFTQLCTMLIEEAVKKASR